MHICVIASMFPVRSQTFVREHVTGLMRRGHHVTVLSGGKGEGICEWELDELHSGGVKLVNLPRFGENRFLNLLRMIPGVVRRPLSMRLLMRCAPWSRAEMFRALRSEEWLRLGQPDVIHVHFGIVAGALQRALKAMRCEQRLVVTWHGYDANAETRVRGRDLYRDLFDGRHSHTANSNFLGERLVELGCRRDRLFVVPMGINIGRFAFKERAIEQDEALRLVSVGRLDEMKGHEYLIEATTRLIRAGIRVQLRIVGDGPLRKHLEQQVSRSGLSQVQVNLLGALESRKVVEELAQAHVFALTGVVAGSGRVETQGVVFAEAQASGLPVIGSQVGGVPESVVDGRTGVLCPPKDPVAIADAIRTFVEDPAKIGRYGREGRRLVEQRFGLESMLDSFEAIYSECVPAS